MARFLKTRGYWVAIPIVSLLLWYGCDVGINPLLFDGSPLQRDFTINTDGTSFADTGTIDLNTAIKNISKDIDSIRVFNITVRLENTGSTPAGAIFNGTASFEGTPFATMTNVSLSTLSTERSIFNTTGLAFNSAGMSALTAALVDAVNNPDTPHSRTFNVTASSSVGPVQLTIHLKVYTQVFTTP
jgi:hypothetical protein